MGAGNVTLQLHAPLDFPFGEYCHEVVGQVISLTLTLTLTITLTLTPTLTLTLTRSC